MVKPRGHLLLLGLGLFITASTTSPRAVAGCTSAADACREWVSVAGRPERVLIYRSHPLTVRNDSLRQAIIMVHGGGRTASDSFDTTAAAAFLAKRLDTTMLIAPRFSSSQGACKDSLASSEANWGCEDRQPDTWRNGAGAINDRNLTSFDVIDELLRGLARKDRFPNMQSIVVAGHSGGGQFTMRYAMSSTVADDFGVPISFVVSNPDALVYFDTLRPTTAAYPPNAAIPGYGVAPPSEAFAPYTDAHNCGAFNEWPYGLEKRSGYSAPLNEVTLRTQYVKRNVTYLLGALDILPLANFDQTCPALAQGPTRLARSLAFAKYVNERFRAAHKTEVIAGCGHNDRCLFTSASGLKVLFPESAN